MARADATHQRLLRAAIELFTTRGYERTTTPLIARKAGVAEGTIYRHFAGKQNLWNELYRGALRWALSQLRQAEEGDRIPARAQLDRLAQALIGCAARDPAVIRLAFLQPAGALADEPSRTLRREFEAGIERIVARGKADGTVRAGSAVLWAGVWLATVRHVLERISDREWGEGHGAVAQVVDAAWRAIAVGEAGPGRRTSSPPALD